MATFFKFHSSSSPNINSFFYILCKKNMVRWFSSWILRNRAFSESVAGTFFTHIMHFCNMLQIINKKNNKNIFPYSSFFYFVLIRLGKKNRGIKQHIHYCLHYCYSDHRCRNSVVWLLIKGDSAQECASLFLGFLKLRPTTASHSRRNA